VPSVAPGLDVDGGVRVRTRSLSNRKLRQPEIQNLGMSALGDKYIGRLDVAVDDTSGVSCVERVGYVDGDGEKNFRFQRTPRNAMLQRQPIQKLHSDERLPVLLANVVNRADIRMVQCGGGLGFALKASECLRVFGNIVRKKFQGDEAM
jgi:hypothetical protein